MAVKFELPKLLEVQDASRDISANLPTVVGDIFLFEPRSCDELRWAGEFDHCIAICRTPAEADGDDDSVGDTKLSYSFVIFVSHVGITTECLAHTRAILRGRARLVNARAGMASDRSSAGAASAVARCFALSGLETVWEIRHPGDCSTRAWMRRRTREHIHVTPCPLRDCRSISC